MSVCGRTHEGRGGGEKTALCRGGAIGGAIIVIGWAILAFIGCRGPFDRAPAGLSRNPDAYGYVVHVDDGDSFALQDGRRVRMIGVDCFETHENDKLFRDARRTGRDVFWMMRWGRRAGRYSRRMLLHRWVRLEFDQERRDRYGRLLAYVFIPVDEDIRDEDAVVVGRDPAHEEIFVNATLIKKGLARTLFIKPNTKHMSWFKALENQARRMGKGFWREWEEEAGQAGLRWTRTAAFTSRPALKASWGIGRWDAMSVS